MGQALDILEKHWKHRSFRPLQEEIITSVADGNDVLALLPTGGGKSICFQIPALMREGTCIVISPLIALMKDQVEGLRKRGITAEAVHSGMSSKELDMAFERAVRGDSKFLYLSPERLNTVLFTERLKRMKLSLVAIDEAHCISQWGHEFRPAYRNILDLREKLDDVPFIALTASAALRVRQDILDQLGMDEARLFAGSYHRPNLIYMVRKVDDKFGKLLSAIEKSEGSKVVYAGTRRKTVDIAKHLVESGISARPYHAGMSSHQKQLVQQEWISGKFPVIVATNAFGMGIDKPDVRLVAHMDIPLEPEAYFQEAGRAGRDGDEAIALLICNDRDVQDLVSRAEERYPEKEIVLKTYNALCNLTQIAIGAGKDHTSDLDLKGIARLSGLNHLEIYHSLRILELDGYIRMSSAFYQPSRILFITNRENLYDYQIRNPKMDPLIKLMLRTYGSLFDVHTRIDEGRIAGALGIQHHQLRSLLQHLNDAGILDYIPASDSAKITFTRDREDSRYFRLSPSVYSDRKQEAIDRAAFMKSYVLGDACRSITLLSYFGESDSPVCGKCENCLKNQGPSSGSDILKRLPEFNSIEDLSQALNWSKEDTIESLRELEDKGEIISDGLGWWKLK